MWLVGLGAAGRNRCSAWLADPSGLQIGEAGWVGFMWVEQLEDAWLKGCYNQLVIKRLML
jgi:hypothetical protein